MPIHLSYQGTTCSKCGSEFIAYPDNLNCPACSQPAGESFDFINATVATMKDHKQIYGNYFPDTWYSGSTADLMQGIIFELFDNLEAEKPKDIARFFEEQLGGVEMEEGQEHLLGQAKKIAAEVHKIYIKDPDFKGNALKDKPINPKLKDMGNIE